MQRGRWVPADSDFDYGYVSTLSYPSFGGNWHSYELKYEVRILHPAYTSHGKPLSWQAVAESTSSSVDPMTEFGNVAYPGGVAPRTLPIFDLPPAAGHLPDDLITVVRRHLDFRTCMGLSWEGNAEVSVEYPPSAYNRVEVRDYGDFLPLEWADTLGSIIPITGLLANYAWPVERHWILATGVDDQSTIIAARDRTILDRLAAEPALETTRIIVVG